jgi:hypothetical protein
MTDDLVKRLRKRQEFEFIDGYKRIQWEDEDALEAADRIEELEKSIRNMQQDVAFLRRLRAAGVDNWEGYEFALEDDDD